jgi:Lrp/AsnC family transcriptional regulator, leucine-responsive regulatory protein
MIWKADRRWLPTDRRESVVVTYHLESPLDATDWKILRELQRDARLSYHELGRRVALSAPATAERVRKLEDRGIITGYAAKVNPEKVGLPILTFIQLSCAPEKCLMKTRKPDAFPEILDVYILNTEPCSLLKVVTTSMKHLKALIERLGEHGNVKVHIVTSTEFNRMIDWERPEVELDPQQNPGWLEQK